MGHEALLKSTVAPSLAWDDNHERQVDRIVAIAYTKSDLGSLLLRVEALDANSLRKVILLIARSLDHSHNIRRSHGERIAVAVLHEILQPGCPNCGGKGEIHREAEAVVSCHHCGGTGLHRYSDSDRQSLIGHKFNGKAYEAALRQVRDALVRVVRAANNHLSERNI